MEGSSSRRTRRLSLISTMTSIRPFATCGLSRKTGRERIDSSMTITVFTTGPACHRCTLVKGQLSKNNIPFEEIRVDVDDTWADRLKAYGLLSAPVVLVDDDDVWEGVEPLRELIKDYRAMAA
ncbi:glutaredoxin domain-containing protein [Mycobacteroides abscessus]|uniref:glutaredoxin domain-containing protein n=1 Tax=Mycobacteroides abscessus TaxID=36809 RepID=UPI000993DCE4|nr:MULTISPECIES: glutaredoxin domain-containing protein [Mycobacteroides]